MGTTGWLIVIVGLLTLLGSGILAFITVRYYWGERGTPPITGPARRRQREEELKQRAKQIEFSKNNPRKDRSPDFFDNRRR
jgi:hypothetical protein